MAFLFDNQLISELENLIKNSKNKLILISPYINIDGRIKDALFQKRDLPDFELKVLFGKNENNNLKSISKESLDFFMTFPNIEIRHNERLHAKFYLNDYSFIVTSLNLYDYSLAKNIEIGIKFDHSSKGLIGKVFDTSGKIINSSLEKVSQEVLGTDSEVDPIVKFNTIFYSSELKYKTEPILEDKKGMLNTLMGTKKVVNFKVIENKFNDNIVPKIERKETQIDAPKKPTIDSNIKTASISQLEKSYKMSKKDLTDMFEQSGYIKGNEITQKGKENGLSMKNYMGTNYIAYPMNLIELTNLKK